MSLLTADFVVCALGLRRVELPSVTPDDDHPLPLLVAALDLLLSWRRPPDTEVLQVLRVRARRPVRHMGCLRVDRQRPLPRGRRPTHLHQREGGRPLAAPRELVVRWIPEIPR